MENKINYLKDIASKWDTINDENISININWKKNNSNTEYFIKFKNIIGENEANLINQIAVIVNNSKILCRLIIEFSNVKIITPVFVSNLFLLTRRNVKIIILVPFDDDTTYQLFHLIGTDFLIDENSKNKIFIYRQRKGDEKEFYDYQQPVSVVSSSFLPSINISKSLFDEFLYKTYEYKNSNESLTMRKNKYLNNQLTKSEIYSFYYDTILNDIGVLDLIKDDRSSYCIEKLTKIRFFERIDNKSLLQIMLLRLVIINSFYWKHKEGISENLYIVGLEKNTLQKAETELIGTIKNKKTLKCIEKFVDFINRIYHFVDSIYPGVYEISKNVIEHSTNKTGAVTIRLFDRKDIQKIKNVDEHSWNQYFNDKDILNVQKFIDISIVDDGEKGIFETLYHDIKSGNLREFAKEVDRQSIEVDLRQLTKIINDKDTIISDELYFRLFQISFSNTNKDVFTFQLKKASAGYGLMVFTANILENKGCYSVRTYSDRHNIQYGFFKGFNQENNSIEGKVKLKGTHYNFILPLIPKAIKKENEKLYNEQKNPSNEDIFKSLTNYRFESGKEFINSNGIRYKHDKIHFIDKYIIDVYDFINSTTFIDRSELLRFLAEKNLSGERKSNIIVYNLNYDSFHQLIDLLRIIYKYFHRTFWSDPNENSQSILFYCKNNLTKLISVFLLGGKSIKALLMINRKISYYQYVQIPIEDKLDEIRIGETGYSSGEIKNIMVEPFFVNGHPVFFDMILPATIYHTIFEANVHEVLTKEIKL